MASSQAPDVEGALQLWLTDPDDKTFDNTSMRLSTACVCRRLREWVKPDLYHAFPEYLDARGHGFEAIMATNLERTGHTFQREVKVPWAHGESGMDFLVTAGPMCEDKGGAFVIELKANKEAEIRSENRMQLQRQRRCVEIAAESSDEWAGILMAVDDRWFVYVIDPTTWRIPNPSGYLVPLDDERRAEIDAELALTSEYAAKIDKLDPEWETNWPLCTCGSCWDPPVEHLNAEIEGLVITYLELREEAKFAQAQQKLLMQDIKERIIKCAQVAQHDYMGWSWEGVGVKVSVSKDGRFTPNRMKPKARL